MLRKGHSKVKGQGHTGIKYVSSSSAVTSIHLSSFLVFVHRFFLFNSFSANFVFGSVRLRYTKLVRYVSF